MNDDNNIYLASSNSLVKINVEDLKVGMYVSKLDKPHGFLIKTLLA
jgi:hypothetical protein